MFYVYEWFNTETNEVFYVGKGCNNRYKNIAERNDDFKDYISKNPVDVRIVKYFENEQDSFDYEELLTRQYKDIGQCSCNKRYGGCGGVAGIWTQEMRDKMSKDNPMKAEEQRLRMFINNPMKNPEVAAKVSLDHAIPVIINGVEYPSSRIASEQLGVHIATVQRWCSRGYDTNYNPCRYITETQKEYTIKKTCSKRVLIDDKYEFATVKEAAEFCGGNSSNLGRAIRAGRPYRGHKCSYVNQQPSYMNSELSSIEGSTTNG